MSYTVKSSFLLSFLESVPEVSVKLKDANTKERKFEDVVKAAVLVLVVGVCGCQVCFESLVLTPVSTTTRACLR